MKTKVKRKAELTKEDVGKHVRVVNMLNRDVEWEGILALDENGEIGLDPQFGWGWMSILANSDEVIFCDE